MPLSVFPRASERHPPAPSPGEVFGGKPADAVRQQFFCLINPVKHLEKLRRGRWKPSCYFQHVERFRATTRGTQQASCWPASVACSVVLTCRKPLPALRCSPIWQERRREDLPFERKTFRGCSDSVYRRPPEYRGGESKRGDARCAQGNKHCSYVFVDSNRITGGRIRPANTRKPRPP